MDLKKNRALANNSHTCLLTSPIKCAIRPRKIIKISSDMKLDNVVIPKEEENLYLCSSYNTSIRRYTGEKSSVDSRPVVQ